MKYMNFVRIRKSNCLWCVVIGKSEGDWIAQCFERLQVSKDILVDFINLIRFFKLFGNTKIRQDWSSTKLVKHGKCSNTIWNLSLIDARHLFFSTNSSRRSIVNRLWVTVERLYVIGLDRYGKLAFIMQLYHFLYFSLWNVNISYMFHVLSNRLLPPPPHPK